MRQPTRRRNESRFEYFKRRVNRANSEAKLAVGAVASLAAIALGVYGVAELNKEDTSKVDKGTAKVGKCAYTAGRLAIKDPSQPKTTAPGERLPKGSGPYFVRIFLDEAVNRLADAAPRNGLGEARDRFSNSNQKMLSLIAAEEEVFYKQTDGITTDETFQIDNPETKLDDDSEVFCTYDGKAYLTPEAASAVVAIGNAGITIEPQLSATIK